MLTAENPDLTFLVPVCNSGDSLGRLLTSLCLQTHSNIEIVVVNDGSSDNSMDIARYYAERDGRVILAPSENPEKPLERPQDMSEKDWRNFLADEAAHAKSYGTLAARMAGIRVASGKYILAIDPDDAFEWDGAEKLLKLAAKKNNPDVVTFDLQQFETDENGMEHRVWRFCPARHGYLFPSDTHRGQGVCSKRQHVALYDLVVTKGHYWSLCLKMVKRELYREALKMLENFHCTVCGDLYMDIAAEIHAKDIYKANCKPYLHYGAGFASDRGSVSLADVKRLCSALRALDLSMKMLPEDLKTPFKDIVVTQCRTLLSHCERVEPESDIEKAKETLLNCGYCSGEMRQAVAMPVVKSTGEGDLPGFIPRPLRKTVAAMLPDGTRRRLFFKTFVKRITGH